MSHQSTPYEVYWYGPYAHDPANGLHLPPDIHSNNVLYMICGTHGMYGKNVPLYIGQTNEGIGVRISQHNKNWLEDEPDPVQIYTACIGKLHSWEHNSTQEEYAKGALEDHVISEIESLLIYVHQPVYNRQCKQGSIKFKEHITVFNTGRRSTLYPEVSTLRWVGDSVGESSDSPQGLEDALGSQSSLARI